MTKGEKAKESIAQAAQELFRSKGFASTSMSDICDATGFSRGGLYRHYSSTKEIYLHILEGETEKSDEVFRQSLKAIPPLRLLELFFSARAEELSASNYCTDISAYELCRLYPECKSILAKRAEIAAKRLEEILTLCFNDHTLCLSSPKDIALQMLFILEGIGLAQPFLKLKKEEIEHQLQLIIKPFRR